MDIERHILLIRGQRVMLDCDLATIYGVKTMRLNEAVKRNGRRFPEDFAFLLTRQERDEVIANCDNLRKLKFSPSMPHAFTEHGVAMLSSVLHSERAVQANIAIVRAFVQLRKALAASPGLAAKMLEAEKRLSTHDAVLGEHAKAIRAVFEDIRSLMEPRPRLRRPRRDRKWLQVVTTIRR